MMEVFNLKVKNGNLWRSINKIYLPYSVHFNRYGNKLIANEVTENLK